MFLAIISQYIHFIYKNATNNFFNNQILTLFENFLKSKYIKFIILYFYIFIFIYLW